MPLQYNEIADLLADESFINFCKGQPADAARWEAFKAESAANAELVEAARNRFLDIFNAIALADRDEQEARLSNRLFGPGPAPVVPMHNRPRPFRRLLKWAAMLVPAVGIALGAQYYFSHNKTTVYHTALGERKVFHLPDGSFVRLNAGSSLRLCKDFGAACRDLYLEGEAFFEVRHHVKNAFVVHTENMDVRAVGTAFNVNAYAGNSATETTLLNGVVEVTLKGENAEKVVLRPDHKITWNANTVRPAGKSPAADSSLVRTLVRTSAGDIPETGWVNNLLIFENEPLSAIAEKLERWYGTHVVIEDESLRHYRFTGKFEKESVEEVLNVCRESRHFNYELVPGEPPAIRIFK